MKPIVVIPTDGRLAITVRNLELLLPYTNIVLVVSTEEEHDYYRWTFLKLFFVSQHSLSIVVHPNKPLGKKFQYGVDYARTLPHDCMVITGSDDILSKNFWETIVPESEGRNFTGLRSWYIFHEWKLYWFDYLAAHSLPLGGGRIYSREFLESIDYKLFDTSRNIWLDDYGWSKAAKTGDYKLLHSPEILAVKGDWEVLNPFRLKHKNINLRAQYGGWQARQIMKEKFGYEVPPEEPKVYHLR